MSIQLENPNRRKEPLTAEEEISVIYELDWLIRGISMQSDVNMALLQGFVDQYQELKEKQDIFKLEERRWNWSKSIFTEATAKSSMLKLKGEADEVLADIEQGKREPKEYADILMCLFDSARRQDTPVMPQDIFDAFAEKLDINEARKWKKNLDNSYSHIK